MAVATRAASAGRTVEVLDDALELGGTCRALVGEEAAPWRGLVSRFERLAGASAITVRRGTTAAAVYGDDLLVAGEEGAEIVTARALVLASGAHDGVLPFEGNDLPGVVSARAAGWLLARGVVLGERVVVCAAPEATGTGEAFARAVNRGAGGACQVEVVHGVPIRAEGSRRVRGVTLLVNDRERHFKLDALVIDAPRAPAYELCEQAGARLRHAAAGFIPVTERGKIRAGVFAIGEVTGAPLDVAGFEGAAEEIAGQI